jgi:hypothetical protein
MTVLKPNVPIEQRSATLLVENKLDVGVHRFALEVLSARGTRSEAQVFSLTVQKPGRIVIGPGTVVNPVLNPVLQPVVSPVVRPVSPRRPTRSGGRHEPR